MLSNNVNFNGSMVSVAEQLEEMRRVLGCVYREVSGGLVPPSSLDELIGELLGYGVTRHEIAFLICEALPVGGDGLSAFLKSERGNRKAERENF